MSEPRSSSCGVAVLAGVLGVILLWGAVSMLWHAFGWVAALAGVLVFILLLGAVTRVALAPSGFEIQETRS